MSGVEFNLTGSPAEEAYFELYNGGTATHERASVGWSVGTAGQVSIAAKGTGSWTINGQLNLGITTGVNSGTGVIKVYKGGTLAAGHTFFRSVTSRIEVDSGAYTTGTLDSEGLEGSITLVDPPQGAAMNINGASGLAFYYGDISGSGSVVKSGGSTQTLAGANTYTGSTTVNGGTLVLDSATSSSYTANSGGTLRIPFGNFVFTSLRANAGGTIVYDVSRVVGGFLRGTGTHNISSVRTFEGTTFGADVLLSQNAPLTLNNVNSSGRLNNNALLLWDGGINTSAGSIIVNSVMTLLSFENEGTITINAGGTLNNSVTNLVNGGGAKMIVNHDGHVVLAGGTSLDLNGSLLVNNGVITGPTNVNYGSLAKGAGIYGAINITDGGRFSPGNSPGLATSGATTWNAGGNYVVEIGDAGGVAGEGWDKWLINGQLDLGVLKASGRQFTISLASLNELSAGLAGNFDPSRDYTWPILRADGGIVGFDPAEIALDVSGFQNDVNGGQFTLEHTSSELAVHFSAVPEPGAVALVALAAAVAQRRRRIC